MRQVETLMSPEISSSGAKVSVEVIPADLEVPADEKLMEKTIQGLQAIIKRSGGLPPGWVVWEAGHLCRPAPVRLF